MADEINIEDIPVEEDADTEAPAVPGTAITVQEVQNRLSDKLYRQLSDGSSTFVQNAIDRAEIYVLAIIRRFGLDYTLDDATMREITLVNAIAELHLALGNVEGAKELRLKAKDLVLAAYGDYPDTSGTATAENTPGADVREVPDASAGASPRRLRRQAVFPCVRVHGKCVCISHRAEKAGRKAGWRE